MLEDWPFISPASAFAEAASRVLSGKIWGGKVPEERIHVLAEGKGPSPRGTVLYWMHINRRWSWNYAVDRALEWLTQGMTNFYILETLPFHQTLTDRHAVFVMQGMAEHERLVERGPIIYRAQSRKCGKEPVEYLYSFIPSVDVLIVDDHPEREYRKFLETLPQHTSARIEAIDSSGLVPFRSVRRCYPTARGFRTFIRGRVPENLLQLPDPRPLPERFPLMRPLVERPLWIMWQKDHEAIVNPHEAVKKLAIDHSAGPVSTPGGPTAARKRWRQFLDSSLEHYPERRDHPDENGVSGLAPYLHFGFISPYEMMVDLLKRAVEMGWSCEKALRSRERGTWWHLPPCVGEFLEQFLVWRELGLNLC